MLLKNTVAMRVLAAPVGWVALNYGPGIGEWLPDPQSLEAVVRQVGYALFLAGAGTIGGLVLVGILFLINFLREK